MANRRPTTRGRRRPPAAVQDALFEVETPHGARYYQQILDALGRSDMSADVATVERAVSRLCGAVWSAQDPPRDASVEESFGLGLVDQARQRRTPTAVALLATLAVLSPVREVRDSAAAALHPTGTPSWLRELSAAPTGRCWSYEDVFGDVTTVICEFERAGAGHAVMVWVDHCVFSSATDVAMVEGVSDTVRDLQNSARTSDGLFSLRQLDPGLARSTLERAFARTDLVGPSVGPSFADLRALALTRVRALPDRPDGLAAEPPPPDPHIQAVLVDQFLSDHEAAALPAPEAAATVARLVAEYACVYDPGDPTRVSPGKWEIFIQEWLPRRLPDPDLREAVPEVVRAWSTWAARRRQLTTAASEELTLALDEVLRGGAG